MIKRHEKWQAARRADVVKAIEKDLFFALNSNQGAKKKMIFVLFFLVFDTFRSLHWKMVDNNDTSTRETSAYISLNEITVN